MVLNLLDDQKGEKVREVPVKAVKSESPAAVKNIARESAPPQQKPPLPPLPQSAKIQTKEESYTEPEALPKGFAVNILGGTITTTAASSAKTWGIFLGSAVIAGILLGAWWWWLNTTHNALAQSLAAAENDIAATQSLAPQRTAMRKNLEAQLYDIDVAQILLSRHIYWTRFFRFLETVTIPDVYYRTLAVDPSGTVRLAAVGRDFAAVSRQLTALQASEDVQQFRMTKAASELVGEVPGVQFDLELTVQPSLLYEKK